MSRNVLQVDTTSGLTPEFWCIFQTCNAILRIRTALNTLDLTMSELLREVSICPLP